MTRYYKTVAQASNAAEKLGICSSTQYMRRHIEDPKLPPHPDKYYSTEWEDIGLWLGFFKIPIIRKPPKANYYKTITELKEAVNKLGIKNATEYKKSRSRDRRLPIEPHKEYPEDWVKTGKWKGLFNKRYGSKYKTLEEARDAVKRLGISSCPEYKKRFKEDPGLVSKPQETYSDRWASFGKWNGLFGRISN